jgi:hypothetical protein
MACENPKSGTRHISPTGSNCGAWPSLRKSGTANLEALGGMNDESTWGSQLRFKNNFLSLCTSQPQQACFFRGQNGRVDGLDLRHLGVAG